MLVKLIPVGMLTMSTLKAMGAIIAGIIFVVALTTTMIVIYYLAHHLG